MANKNFIVQNGLTVGAVTIDATSGNITTAGSLATGSLVLSGNITFQGGGGSEGGSYELIEDFGSGGDWASGDVKTDASNAAVVKATVSGGWSSNAIAAFSGLTTSSTGITVSIGGSYTGPETALSDVQYFAGNSTYVLTFVSSVNQGLTDWSVAALTMVNPATSTPTSINASAVNAGGLQAAAIGNITPGTGTFTTLTADSLDVAGGGLNGVAIGASTPSTGAFTTLAASGVTTLSNTTETTEPGNGALVLSGGASIDGNAYVANNLYIGSTSFDKSLTTPTIIAIDNGSNYAQIAMINSSGNGSADFAAYADNGTDTGGWVDMGIAGSTFSDSNYGITKPHDGYLISRALDNTYGGNLVIGTSEIGTHKDIVIGVGGFSASSEVARFHGNVSTSGKFGILYNTPSTSTTTGALTVVGGAGIGGDLYVGGNISAAALNTISSSQLEVTAPLVYLTGDPYPYDFDIGMYSHFIGGPANVYTHTGAVRSYQNGYWGFFSNVKQEPTGTVDWTDSALIWDTVKMGAAVVANTTATTSTTSGALTVAGGAGIAGAVYIGGNGTNAMVHTGHILPSSNVTYNLGSSTAWYGTYYGVATQAKYADLAENYQADENYAPGQVLMFGGEQEVTLAVPDTKAVAGVVSTNPAHLMNGQLRGNKVVAIALQGRVPCNVIGPISKGDLLISAGFGYARANNMAAVGQVIGKALENFNGAKGVIEVVVGRV